MLVKFLSFSLLLLFAFCSLCIAQGNTDCTAGQTPIGLEEAQGGSLKLICKSLPCITTTKERPFCRNDTNECKKGEWVNGIKQAANGLVFQCCNISLLYRRSNIIETKNLGANSNIEGQVEVIGNGSVNATHRRYQQVITNVKATSTNKYSVEVTRMPCRTAPSSIKTEVDGGVAAVGGALGGALGTALKDNMCFPSDSTVRTPTGTKQMKDLQIGDHVLSMNSGGVVSYKPVLFFLHRNANHDAEFVQLRTTSATIELTAVHAIYKMPCTSNSWNFNFRDQNQLAYAKEISVGDCLLVQKEKGPKLEQVLAVQRIVKQGIFAPLTENGVIVVDNIVASCYVYTKDGNLNRHVTEYLSKFMEVLSYVLPNWMLDMLYVRVNKPEIELVPVLNFATSHLDRTLPYDVVSV